MPKFTINDLKKLYPNDDACLDYLFHKRFPDAKGYYRVKGRKCYSHQTTRHQIHPLAGTIFEKSSTPLTLWFHAIFLFSTSKNGVSAKELQRQLGVTYKCAWRMAFEIRTLMGQDGGTLSGTVEIDETYYGKGGRNATKFKNKSAILGMVERKGQIRAKQLPNRRVETILPVIKNTVERGSHVVTDEYRGYDRLSGSAFGYPHSSVKHGAGHYSWKGQDTNAIEGFWGQFKRSVRGTYHFVSAQHLQHYVDEFAFRYNQRASSSPVFETLMARI
ncbi:MAG: IS1595 family transposase [Minisyncoccia bacterium]